MNSSYLWITAIGAMLGCLGCGTGYHDRIISSNASSEWIATSFVRQSTSALDDDATYVSTRVTGTPDDKKNHGGIVLEVRGEVNLGLDWSDGHHLTISCPGCSHKNIDFQVIKVSDLKISYAGFVDSQ